MKDVACELSRTFIHLLCLFRRPQSNLKIQQVSNGEMNYEIYLMEYYIVIKLFTESEATWKIHIMVHEKENTNIYTQYACHELHNNEKKKLHARESREGSTPKYQLSLQYLWHRHTMVL